MRRAARALVVVLTLTLPGIATALPVLSVDADPGLPGIQTERSVPLGSGFDVAIVIEAVDPEHPLHAFELVLSNDAALGGVSVELGDFLGVDALAILAETSATGVELAATRLGPTGSTGSGVLAIVHYTALALGSGTLSLADVLLSEPFGVPLAAEALRGARIDVVVPESATGSLVIGGLLALAGTRRTRA